MSEYPKHPCRLCDGFIQAGEDESKWGLDWYKGYVHFSCIENIFDATRRMVNKPEYAALKQFKDDVYAAYTPNKHCNIIALEKVLLLAQESE